MTTNERTAGKIKLRNRIVTTCPAFCNGNYRITLLQMEASVFKSLVILMHGPLGLICLTLIKLQTWLNICLKNNTWLMQG